MRYKWLLIVIPVAAMIFIAFMAGMVSFFATTGGDASIFGGGRVGVIEVRGPIISAEETVKDIEELKKEDKIKSVILRIESPGGSVGASQEILEAVKLLAKEKPLVASMGSVAASGGYYIACGATKILANPGTITGSIGVRMEHVAIGDLLRWAKVNLETLKSGRYKDIGTVERPLTDEERGILQELLDELRGQFKKEVMDSRGLSAEKVEALADGRVFTGIRAKDLGLVDEIGGFAEAIKLAAQLGGVSGEPELAYPKKRGGFIKRMVEGAAESVDFLAGSAMDYWRPAMKI